MAHLHTSLNGLLARLETAGRRITQQRTAVCEALLEHGDHPTASEIWQRVHTAHPSISQATVYNTISALEQLQLIHRLEIAGDEHAHYDVDVEPHVNVVCTRCGRIVDVYTDTLEALLGLVANRSGYRIELNSGMIVYGICAACGGVSQ